MAPNFRIPNSMSFENSDTSSNLVLRKQGFSQFDFL